MSLPRPPGALMYTAPERNKPHILDCLQQYISPSEGQQILLEVGAGTGQHASHFAPFFPYVCFKPTEMEPKLLKSIEAFRTQLQLPNFREAAILDVSKPADTWLNSSLPKSSVHYVLSINLVHISPWNCCKGLFEGAAYVLKSGGYLFMYGPYAMDGKIIPQSNVNFDKCLRLQDPEWGLRDITRQLVPLATTVGLELFKIHDLPANNKFLVWLKHGD